MLNSINNITSQVTSAWNATSKELAATLTRIATGKKFQNAAEDLSGFIRSTGIKADISGYDQVRQDLTEFKTYTASAVQASSSMYEALNEMKDIASKYDAADADQQDEYEAEFNALQTQVSSMITNTKVDGTSLVAVATVKSVDIDPNGTALAMTFTAANTTAVVDAFDLSAGGAAAVTAVQGEIDNTLTYMSEAKSFDAIADQQTKLTETIINSKKAVLSYITEIDDVEESGKALDLTIRQESAMSMLAQANMTRQSILKLYE